MNFDPNKFSPYPKAEKKQKERRPRTIHYKKKEPTGELILFGQILKERGAKSQISGEPIYGLRASNFAHVLAKGGAKYPKFKLYKRNVIIVTDDEHFTYDNGLHEELRKDPRWSWVFTVRDLLISDYRNPLKLNEIENEIEDWKNKYIQK